MSPERRRGRSETWRYGAGVVEFAVPIMPANDLDATLSFYERLGFENAGSAPSDWNYLIIRRGSVQLGRAARCSDGSQLSHLCEAHLLEHPPLLSGREPLPVGACILLTRDLRLLALAVRRQRTKH